MTTAALTLALLRMLDLPAVPGRMEADARLLAATIVRAAAAHGIDPLQLAAVAAHESRFRREKVGAKGERGRWQVMPATAHLAGYHLRPEALANDPINADVAAWWLARVKAVCTKRGVTSPYAWLSKYAGHQRCSRTPYSAAVMALVEKAYPRSGEAAPPALAAYWDEIGGTAPVATTKPTRARRAGND